MDVGDVQEAHLAVVSLFTLVPLPGEHISQRSVVPPRIINLYVMFLVDLFCPAQEIRALCYGLYHFLVKLTPISHHSCFYLTASEESCETL